MREAIQERRTFARIAPRFVAPLPFVMPTSRSITRNALAMKAAFAIDSLVGFDRNRRLDTRHLLPPGRVISRRACRALSAETGPSTAGTGALWYDYVTLDSERLTLAFAIGAVDDGAAWRTTSKLSSCCTTKAHRRARGPGTSCLGPSSRSGPKSPSMQPDRGPPRSSSMPGLAGAGR